MLQVYSKRCKISEILSCFPHVRKFEDDASEKSKNLCQKRVKEKRRSEKLHLRKICEYVHIQAARKSKYEPVVEDYIEHIFLQRLVARRTHRLHRL